ncbi:MAG: xanthine dehydrogenase family protein subunit M [Actinomycetota bacterium]
MQVPAPFEYHRATSVDEAIDLRRRLGPGARFVAGGHSLLPMMKLRLATPDHLIDINELSDLARIHDGGAEITIGAMVRHADLLESETLARRLPIFREAERVIADPLVRRRGTIGGSLCQADPSEDLTAVCDALDARLVIRSATGDRTVAIRDFYRGPYETAVGDDEMLTELVIPVRTGGGSAFEKVERRAGDWAVVSVAANVWLDGAVIGDGRVGLAAVGPDMASTEPVSDLLRGATPSDELFAAVGEIAATGCNPRADQRGSVAYKRHLVKELTTRCLRRAVDRAQGTVI